MNRFLRSLIRGGMLGAVLGAYVYFRNRRRERAYYGTVSGQRVEAGRARETRVLRGQAAGQSASSESQTVKRVIVRRTR